MSKKHSVYAKDIRKFRGKCTYLILNSSRGTGKSYAVKEDVIDDFLKNGKEFIYLRRLADETRDIDTIDYFSDTDVKKITNGEYNDIYVYRKRIYLRSIDDNGDILDSKKIGYVVTLMHTRNRKSLQYPNVGTIIFEEYSTDDYYLTDEPSKLMDFMSTVFRDREGFCVMLGNKMNIFNPYEEEWGLNIRGQRVGAVDTYNRDGVIIKVWDIEKKEDKSKIAFGNASKSIDGNEYIVKTYQKIDIDNIKYNIIHTVYLIVRDIVFLMRLIRTDKSEVYWYVTKSDYIPKYSERIVTDAFCGYPKTTNDFTPLTADERKCFLLLNKVAFDSDRTGTDYHNALKRLKRG